MIATPRTRESRPAVRAATDFSESPLLVFYEVTQACDLVCQHCRASAQARPLPDELSTEHALTLLDQLGEFPTPPKLVLTGGDPLKRRDIFELIAYAVWVGLDVSLTPSATPLVTPHALRRLREAGISRLAISLDGADAATHDALRGVAGSFDRSLDILADARDLGLELQVNTTLTSANVGQLDRLARFLAGQDIAMWSVFFLVPVGRAAQLARLTADQCEAAFARLWHHTQVQPYAIKTTEAPHYRRFVIQQQQEQEHALASTAGRGVSRRFVSAGVNDGRGIMFVNHAGLIYPSGFLPLVCGVYPLEHLVTIYQQSPLLRSLRDPDRVEGKCRLCEFRRICGGSRARAYAVTGNLFAQEPDCNYVPGSHPPA